MTLSELNDHLDMVIQLATARENLSDMQARILGASKMDGMPHAHEPARMPENLSIALESQRKNVDRLARIVARSETRVRPWVDGIEDSRTRLLFDLRYLCGMKWEDVAGYVGGRNSAEAVKMACYRYLNAENAPQP